MKLPTSGLKLDHDRIVAAIQAAEKCTSGEIRVALARSKTTDPVAAAKIEFERLGMTATSARNGVLIYVAPKSRNFAVIGDTAVHEKCGDAFWSELVQVMTGHFQRGDFEAGIIHAIERAGDLLAAHFPRLPGDRNELPDDIADA